MGGAKRPDLNLIRGLPVGQAIAKRLAELAPRVEPAAPPAAPSRKAPLRPEACIERIVEANRLAMNGWEARYAGQLEIQLRVGEVRRWWFSAYQFRLAPRTFYTPDFLVVLASGAAEVIEIKGELEDDAAVKFKWARQDFPFLTWRMLRWEAGNWKELLVASSAASQ